MRPFACAHARGTGVVFTYATLQERSEAPAPTAFSRLKAPGRASKTTLSPALCSGSGLCSTPASSVSFPFPLYGDLNRERTESGERSLLFCTPASGGSSAHGALGCAVCLCLRSCEGKGPIVYSQGTVNTPKKLDMINLCSRINAFHVWRRMGCSQMSKHLLRFRSCGAVSFVVFWVIT